MPNTTPEQAATRLLLRQRLHSLFFDIRELRFDRNIRFDTVQHFCQNTRITLRELAHRDLRDGVTLRIAGREEPCYIVLLNEDMRDPRRRRFTLAHELGHIYLGHLDDGERQEEEADAFAAALLLPRVLVDQLDQLWGGRLSADELAGLFGVSRSAALRRLAALRAPGGRVGFQEEDFRLLKTLGALLPRPDEPVITI